MTLGLYVAVLALVAVAHVVMRGVYRSYAEKSDVLQYFSYLNLFLGIFMSIGGIPLTNSIPEGTPLYYVHALLYATSFGLFFLVLVKLIIQDQERKG